MDDRLHFLHGRPRGEPGHTWSQTGHAGTFTFTFNRHFGKTHNHRSRGDTPQAHKGTRITPTNLTTIQIHQHTQPARQRDGRSNRGRLNSRRAQARSRPLPAVDSEEAAPSEPDPASTRIVIFWKKVQDRFKHIRFAYTAFVPSSRRGEALWERSAPGLHVLRGCGC